MRERKELAAGVQAVEQEANKKLQRRFFLCWLAWYE
jgi:hypothetical protein